MEKQVIQSVGFRNIEENGEVTGFQLKVRLHYYRGVFLSQIRPGTLIVDSERFEKEDIVWEVKGEEYTYDQLRADWHTHWDLDKPAYIKVKKPGGLAQGFHDITYGLCYTSSYMPPIHQDNNEPDKDHFIFMPEIGKNVHHRRLLIV